MSHEPTIVESAVHQDTPWHYMSVEDVVKALRLDEEFFEDGLTPQKVDEMRRNFGDNAIAVPEARKLVWIIFSNFVNPLTFILLVVLGISIWLNDWAEVAIVVFVIFFNGILGTWQEYNAEVSAAALKAMSVGTAKVRRDDVISVIDIREVVVGDIVILDKGCAVPCDARLIEVNGFSVLEDNLTGEPNPISKVTRALVEPPELRNKEMPVGDRKNMVYRTTMVSDGTAVGICVAVGERTFLGKITRSIVEATESDTDTPLQKSMKRLMYALFVVCAAVFVLVMGVAKWDTGSILYAAAITVAILPEALLATMTVAMTVSVRRMAKLSAIVRRLNALEVMGSVTDICSDKTGTLTQNKMSVLYVLIGTRSLIKVGAQPRSCNAEMWVSGTNEVFHPSEALATDKCFFAMMRCAALNTSVSLDRDPTSDTLVGGGNPSEVAIQALCWQVSLPVSTFIDKLGYRPRGLIPFSSETKMMTAGYCVEGASSAAHHGSYVFVKGAPERVMAKCSVTVAQDGRLIPFGPKEQKVVEFAMKEMAHKGLRCIAFAERAKDAVDLRGGEQNVSNYPRDELERDLIFLGMVGIRDPPRPESLESVQLCAKAGITVRMVTGDHPETAFSISQEVGIVIAETSAERLIAGPDFDSITEEALDATDLKALPLVVGRCSPLSKVHLVKALQRKGRIVAVTGDGTNDAPALKTAQVGCAMGSGSDAAKEASEVIITNDCFSAIVSAVAEGRRIRQVLQKFVLHLLSGNVAEGVLLLLGLSIQWNGALVFVLSPTQILWLNVFTGTPIAIGLTTDKPDADLMNHSPPKGRIISTELIVDTIVSGVALGACALGSFVTVFYGLNDGPVPSAHDCNSHHPVDCDVSWRARTTAYAVLFLGLTLHGYNVRHLRCSLFAMRWFDNPWFWCGTIFNAGALVIQIYVPSIAKGVFQTTRIDKEWGIIAGFLFTFMVIIELYKWVKDRVSPLDESTAPVAPTILSNESIVLPEPQTPAASPLQVVPSADYSIAAMIRPAEVIHAAEVQMLEATHNASFLCSSGVSLLHPHGRHLAELMREDEGANE